MMADSRAFLRLGTADAAAVDTQANRSVMCGGGDAGKTAALVAVAKGLQSGLALQTWTQLLGVFADMRMLYRRFQTEGLPSPDAGVLTQAEDHALVAMRELMDGRLDIAAKLTAHVCKQKQSLIAREVSGAISKSLKATVSEAVSTETMEVKAERSRMEARMEAMHRDMMIVGSAIALLAIGALGYAWAKDRAGTLLK